MSHRVARRVKVRSHADCLKLAFEWLLAGFDSSQVPFRTDCTWTARLLATTALLWVWADEATLVERFDNSRRVATHLFGGKPAGSYQAFMKLLARWSAVLLRLLKDLLRERMRTELADCLRIAGFFVFGVDGSKFELPRTRSNQAAYAHSRKPNRRGKRRRSDLRKRDAAQLLTTTAWHVGTGLPWNWRRGPVDASERDQLLEMAAELPPDALIAADAGFTGYEFLATLLAGGRRILIRVGSNVRLLRKLGYVRESSGTVYLWPDRQARRTKMPPLALRLVESRAGREPVYLLTDLGVRELNDRGVVEIYARRWGIEVFHRNFKQTFGRRKLRSASAVNASVELDWSLVGLWALSLYALVQTRRDAVPPRRLSCAQTLRCLRRTVRDYAQPCARGANLARRLRSALIDDYVRSDKTSRDYPHRKQVEPPGAPRIRNADPPLRRLALNLRRERLEKGLTA